MMLLLLIACKETSLVGISKGNCDISSTDMSMDDTTDLGFSGQQLRDLVGEPVTMQLTYRDDTLGYTDDTATLTDAGDLTAQRVSRSGADCAMDYGAAEVLQATWSVDVETASGDATGTGRVTIEATELDLASASFAVGTNGGDATFAESVWNAYFAEWPDRSTNTCWGGVHWTGPLTEGSWSLNVDCDENGDGSPEFSGAWMDASLVVAP